MDNRKKNNEIRDSERRGIRPEFLGGGNNGRGVKPLTDDTRVDAKRAKKEGAREAAADNLRGAEEGASGGLYRAKDSVEGARGAESGVGGGFYRGKGVATGKSKFKGKGDGKTKKVGPIMGIILAIFGFGGVMMGSQMFQPFSLIAQFQEKFNSMHVSTNLRSARYVKWQMSDITDGNVKYPVRDTVFGSKLKISASQQKKLAAQNIEYKDEVEVDGRVVKKALVFTDTDGVPHIITKDNFDDFYIENPEFHQAYNAGSKTWRGQFANWFGSGVINFLTHNKLTRNLFADFREKIDASPGKSSYDVFKEMIGEKIVRGETTGGVKGGEAEQEMEEYEENGEKKMRPKTDSDGNPVYKTDENGKLATGGGNDESVNLKNMKTESEVKAKLDDISKKFQKMANATCAVAAFFGTASALATAAEVLQLVNLATMTNETVDKVKAGYGDEAPIHELGAALNTKVENTNHVLTGSSGDIVDGKIGTLSYESTVTTNKSAMQSEATSALYGNGKVNPNDPSVASFNLTNSANKILAGATATMGAFTTCTVAKATGSVVGAVTDALEIIGCVAGLIGSVVTAGVTSTACTPLLVSIGRGVAFSAGIAVAISAVVSLITPIVVTAFTRDLVSNLGGEDFGNALASGELKYLGGAHQTDGGSGATREAYAAYLVEQQSVIADQARYERESLSPFDPTSKYTFMGSLINQLAAFSTSSGMLMDMVTTSGAVLSNSVIAMSPTAAAYNIADVLPDMDEYAETCPYLASINAVGDAFCNPYIMTDTTTMNVEPNKVLEKVSDFGGLVDGGEKRTEDDNVIVADGSDLAKYIVYCNNRGSQLGIVDYNIANTVGSFAELNTSITAVNSVVNGAIGAVPVIGDLIDVVNSEKQLANVGYISGEACIAGNNLDSSLFTETPDWNTAKYYQRFIEDQALAESMGIINKSAATAYYESYLEKNPLDDSFEGILARYSGVDKETVALVMDVIWYADYIANYHPEERYAFEGVEFKSDEIEMPEFNEENVLASMMTGASEIIYADLRNRSYAC